MVDLGTDCPIHVPLHNWIARILDANLVHSLLHLLSITGSALYSRDLPEKYIQRPLWPSSGCCLQSRLLLQPSVAWQWASLLWYLLTLPCTSRAVFGLMWPHHFSQSQLGCHHFFVCVTLLLMFLAYFNLRIIYCEAAWTLSSMRPGIIPVQSQTPLLPTAPCHGRCLTDSVGHHCLFSKPYPTWFPNTKWVL